MKGLLALLVLALLCLSVYNVIQIAELRGEVARLEQQLARQEKSADLLAQTMSSLDAARAAVAGLDTGKARSALERARESLGDAAAAAGKQAGPAMQRLERQVSDLTKQLKGNGSAKP